MLISDILSEVFEYLDDRDENLGSPRKKYDLPVFNYPSFLKNIDYYEMISFVKNWCIYYLDDNTEESISAILRSILKLFVARSTHLNTLSIRSTSCEEKYMLLAEPTIFPLIIPLKNLNINCYSIDRLKMAENSPKVNLLNAFVKQCRHLNTIRVNNLSVNDESSMLVAKKLAKLIERQRGLKRIILSRCKTFTNIIIPSLAKQKHSLRHVGFRGVDFDGCCKWDTLKYCTKLERIDMVDCCNLDNAMISPLVNSHSKRLRRVSIYNCLPIRISDKLESWAYRIDNRKRQHC
ncbi:9774_t:CDS:2 [Scutellospora calospora]|uniref:9774_t:CDS:1 n=1 Tax=Scutellospora calospora TaxID=85575 RepID=A0ACA9LRE1_9GLOM|nr:9774_t:CDS:2 [Scutellospora calospora]